METRVDEIAAGIHRDPRRRSPALTRGDGVGPAMAAERQFVLTGVTAATGRTIRRLVELRPRTLAVMHGSSFPGDGASVPERLAALYDDLLPEGRDIGSRLDAHAAGPARPSPSPQLLAH